MNKKIITAITIATILASLTACGGKTPETAGTTTVPTSVTEQTEKTEKKADTLKAGKCEAKLISCELSKDADGNDAVTVAMQFTNNSSQPLYFNQMFYETVFQNGVEQSSDDYYPGEGDWDSYWKEIKDGATITVYSQHPIANTTDPVEVVLNNFEDSKTLTEKYILK